MKKNDDVRDDPRLTAYALGELDGAERAEVEALLAGDETARAAVEEIRATAALVAVEMASGAGAALTAEQRAAVARRAVRKPLLRMRPTLKVAAAAVVIVSAGAFAALWQRNTSGVELAGSLELEKAEGRFDARLETASAATPESGVAVWGPDRRSVPLDSLRASNGQLDEANERLRADLDRRTAAQRAVLLKNSRGSPYEEGGGGGGGGARTAGSAGAFSRYYYGAGGAAGGPAGGAAWGARVPPPGALSGERGDSTEAYASIVENEFKAVRDDPLSTFSIDVDTASYANVRRILNEGRLPPPGAVRIEEMLNYFPYEYAQPTDGRPFAVRVDVAGCPWKPEHRLVRIGLKGREVAAAARPAANLVFLIDVSGSMNSPDKLPLLVKSMKLLVGELEARDRVAMVVYAGSSGLVLPSTACSDKAAIVAALERLQAGGSTNGASGIELAYQVAAQGKIDGGVNRVILATDGDFNVGVTDESSLVRMIEEKAKGGVFLSVLGFGTGNLKDATMEKLADKGNGNYAYVDTLKEGRKALVEQASGTLVTIAKDVKIQVEFNPAQVGAWRLVGYENRVLAAQDFKDDAKDAGEIGAGHTVTALYELAPPGTATAGVDPLKYQPERPAPTASSHELLTVKLRWKEPTGDVSTPMEVPVVDEGLTYSAASVDMKFAASVAAFGMALRGSKHRGSITVPGILELATEGAANDPGGYRREFVDLVKRAAELGLK